MDIFEREFVDNQLQESTIIYNIAIFASGKGSNALNIIKYFEGHSNIKVTLVVSNKKEALVLETAKAHHIACHTLTRQRFYKSQDTLKVLKSFNIHYIILAGFLWLVPQWLVEAYSRRILNIHPALLPRYGGKGMYGMNVHRAVKQNAEKESGMTIHYVNEHFDEGEIIFQAKCPIETTDSPEIIASKVLILEHQYYPLVIEKTIMSAIKE